jgi:HEAT repeat protein
LLSIDYSGTFQVLTRALDNKDKSIRIVAIESLAGLESKARDALPAIVQRLRDPDEDVRDAAAIALKEIGPLAVPLLQESLKSPNPDTRIYSAYSLMKMNPKKYAALVVPVIVSDLKNTRVEIRRLAAEMLVEAGRQAKGAVKALCQALQDKDQDVRWHAIQALGEIGPDAKDAVPELIKALKAQEDDIRLFAADALGKIGPAAKPAIPALGECARSDPEPGNRKVAKLAIRRIKGEIN